MRCSKHPEHEAAGVCAYSGKPYCADELVEVSGKVYGKDNLGMVMAELKEQSGKNQTPMVFMNAGGGGGAASSSSSAAAAVGGGYGRQARSHRSKTTALILACLMFIGIGGLHRIYTGHMLIGIIQLLTLGGFFIWGALDMLMLAGGTFRDAEGRLVL